MFRISSFFKTKIWVKVIVIGVPLVVLGYSAWILLVAPRIWCGQDIRRVDGQCIGVTDGSTHLSADLTDVLNKIQEENERVGQDNPDAVSVAYLVPLPKSSTSEELSAGPRLRHELQGAHIAQLQANHTKELGDKPLIRLLIANSGNESGQWQRVVPALLEKVHGPDRLVAVVATGNTVDATLDAIGALRVGGLPVLLSRLAGDGMPTPEELGDVRGGIARLAPSGRDQGAAAAAYLKPIANRALIVRDTNPDDPFVQALEESFRNAFQGGAHAVLEPPETYDSRLEGVSNQMRGILRNICLQKPEVVYFAGRNVALDAFVQALPLRPCPELQIKIMASGGSTADIAAKVNQGDSALIKGLNSNAWVRYTAQAHPDSWERSPEIFSEASTSHLRPTCEQYCFATVFRDGMLADGGAIIGYDAIVTSVTAIRPGDGTVINDKPELVTQAFRRLHGTGAVAGATGWISLDQFGNPVNKAVVTLEVKPDGTLEFLELSSASGAPCVPDTPPC
ncbi:MAG: hypothetical protein ACRDTG_33065 [Pseudonocardiaceae bacterium]